MTSQIQAGHFVRAVQILLEETLDSVYGIYLDKGTSLFETLATISAEEASIPIGGKCATLAAQVKHVAFYLDVVVGVMQNPRQPPADWGEIWSTVGAVDVQEWDAIKGELRESCNRAGQVIRETPAWTNERQIGQAMGMVVHTAYHLGEIRQALCTLKD